MNKAKMTFRFDEHTQEASRIPVQYPEKRYMPPKQPQEEPRMGYPDGFDDEWQMYNAGDRRTRETYINEPDQAYQTVDMETAQEWGDPFSDYTSTGGVVVPAFGSSPPRRTSWWKVAGSMTGAIVTGGLFGAVVLAMFNQELAVPVPDPGIPAQVEYDSRSDNGIPVMGVMENQAVEAGFLEEEAMLVNIALPQQTYHFLQYGVFSSAGGVELAQRELRDSGVAAARDTVDEKRVYAGVSPDREQAKLLSSQLQATGVNLILHEVSIPASMEVRYDGDVREIEHYMAQSAELIELLSSLSSTRLSEIDPKALSPEEVAEIGEKHQLWTESVSAVRGRLPEVFAEGNAVMETAMNSAVEAVLEYDKKQVKALLWEVQDEVMKFILEQYKIMSSSTL